MQQNIGQKHREQANNTRYTFGGFAPSYAEKGKYKLESTKEMVLDARDLLGGKTWVGIKASEKRFKTAAPNCRVLLLAMHGIADPIHPELSHLLFGDPSADSTGNDNILYAAELQIMQLQADLAILSACHSGFGKMQNGEGVYSLARAFARAGVPATVMSLWLLHENTASPVVQSFIQYLQDGKTKDEALRLAKLDYLKHPDHYDISHPFYWACITANGDMCALDLPKPAKYPKWPYVLLVGLLLGIPGWLILRKWYKA
jgi:CHAT domain-containing protein